MKMGKSKLKLFLTSISMVALYAFLLVSTGYAASVVSSEDNTNPYHGSYGANYDYTTTIKHSTTEWQALGTSAGIKNYGVTWSMDGVNYENEDLYVSVGQTVTFKFAMYSANEGYNHMANVLKSWASYDDGIYESDEVLIKASNLVRETRSSDVSDDYKQQNYYEAEIEITQEMIDAATIYLRARVTCTESIADATWRYYDPWYNSYLSTDGKLSQYLNAFDAYAYYWQGEIEEWKINVYGPENPIGSVPEPATFALFGIGLLGLAGTYRKKSKQK
ncbi:PEP-CTERM sorting domain-containing protein [uncultured Desulfobacter sp.]|uniref:PEP-CTERM sorting domain-containing protein n=1 Tax=uncultured Desulfobacter sp. TaxID=240139 RepID=UPI002AABB343|nr:PEP-CTERM sorting domain-containing protein [uncultured Desulfobacter sp.]